jgi:hypothetical protein
MKRLRQLPLMLAGLGVAVAFHAYELYRWHVHGDGMYRP